MKIVIASDAQSIHTKRWMASLQKSGHAVVVCSFRPGETENKQLVLLKTYGLGKLGYFLSVFQLRLFLKKYKPDVLHAHYLTSYGLVACLTGFKNLVTTGWGSDILMNKKSYIKDWLLRFVCMRSRVVTTVAIHMSQVLVSRTGCAPEKVLTVPFGVDLQLFHLQSSLEKFKSDNFQIICTRNFAPIYNIDCLIQACEWLKKSGVSFSLSLVGKGPLESELKALVRDLNLTEYVKFVGHVPSQELEKLLNEAQVFVSPALSDGNNISLNEAMACGVFPIATNIPANQQWIISGKNGLLYEPANAQQLYEQLKWFYDNRKKQTDFFYTNRTIVEENASWDVCVNKIVEIYKNIQRENLL